MSDDPDDLFPLGGCVRREDACRLAEGRTLVNLDTMDLAPILGALKPLSEVARRLDAVGTPELVFQFLDRWTDLETVLAASGLTGSTAWTYDLAPG
jgi:hypothetical protein